MDKSAYRRWMTNHPIRVWARNAGLPLAAVAATLRISPQVLNTWMGGKPILEKPELQDDRVTRLCELMEITPQKLATAIRSWRDKGEELAL